MVYLIGASKSTSVTNFRYKGYLIIIYNSRLVMTRN